VSLISSEDTTTFVWLFETWLICMKGQAPRTIITDQDKAMNSAINKFFSNAQHRFYLWHILKNLPEKFGSHSQYTAIKSAKRSCVNDSHTCGSLMQVGRVYLIVIIWRIMHGCVVYTLNRLSR
jgi:hypothetical protein